MIDIQNDLKSIIDNADPDPDPDPDTLKKMKELINKKK